MSLVNFKPKNHPHQVTASGADDETDDRHTPARIYDPLHAEHGFTLDVAAAAHNAKCPRYFDLEADGLAQPWTGEIVWCNPPYSDLGAWTRKALYEVQHGCPKVVMLLPANRTEQRWWQETLEPLRDKPGTGVTTRNLPGRPKFGTRDNPHGIHRETGRGPNGERIRKTSSPFGCVVVVIEALPRQSDGTKEGG